MKRTGSLILCCLLILCSGCSFEPIVEDEQQEAASVFSSSEESEASSVQSVPEDGMPETIPISDIGVGNNTGGTLALRTIYVGNVNSKVFHKADCSVVAKIKAQNRRDFKSRDEAIKTGYHPCSRCMP